MNITTNTFAEAYHEILSELIDWPEHITSPRGMKIHETIGAKIQINLPESNLFANEVRSVPLGYLADELILYYAGTDSAEKFCEASQFWKRCEMNGKINSAYGNLLFTMNDRPDYTGAYGTQWDWAVASLANDKDSRQALVHFNRPQHQEIDTKDFPCTVAGQFFIRNDKLDFIIYMRSNDVFFGLTFDFPFFTSLMQAMVLELKPLYPELEVGTYTHFAGSLHAYEKDFITIKSMLNHPFESVSLPIMETKIIKHPFIIDLMDGKMPEPGRYFEDPFIQFLFAHTTFLSKADKSGKL